MLRHCQHRLAFTKKNWYTVALEAILPNNEKKLNKLWRYQVRSTTTLATVLKENEDMPTTTFVTPTTLPVIEPLQSIEENITIKGEEPKVQTHQRCIEYRRYDGQRCERVIKIDPSIPLKEQLLCFNHKLKPKVGKKSKKRKPQISPYHGFNYASEEVIENHIQNYTTPEIEKKIFKQSNKIYDCWDLWIGNYISEEKKILIRKEMEKPASKLDKDGFIYVYSILDGPRASQNTHAYFKIGRTTNPHRRMYQVSNVCKFDPKIIELFPSFPLDKNQKTLSTNLSSLQITMDKIPKCPLSHKVERLIHLELSSLYKKAGFKCPHCGKIHREWIRINRSKNPNGVPMTDEELWLSCIRPVIVKWIKYGVVASAINNSASIIKN